MYKRQVYVNAKQQVITNVIMTDISDHFATIIHFHRTKVALPSTKVTKRWLTTEKYEYLRILLRHGNWEQMRSMNCESATAFLVDKITEAMDIVAPVEMKEISGNTMNTWKTKAINISLNIWSEWRLTVIAATVRIALVDILDLSEVDIPAGGFLYPAVGWG